jgi:addiction module toxin, RelE/StbE family
MRVVWTEPADEDRERLVFYIAEDNPKAATAMDALLTKAADSLATLPFKGRAGRIPETRELVVHRNYIIVYGYDAEAERVYIKAVLHASQKYP